MDFYKCKHCGNMVVMLKNSGVPMICCGEDMVKITENIVDAAFEKHVPAVQRNGSILEIQIGSVVHPMLENHYIEWIIMETNSGYQVKYLHPGEEPKAKFILNENEQPQKVYEYCNLHGLWSISL